MFVKVYKIVNGQKVFWEKAIDLRNAIYLAKKELTNIGGTLKERFYFVEVTLS